jgi:hypothetical protein
LSFSQSSDVREAETPKVSNATEESGCLPATCLVSCSNEIIEFVRDELCNTKKRTTPISNDIHPDNRCEIALKASIESNALIAKQKVEKSPNYCSGSLDNPLQQKIDADPSTTSQDVMPEESDSVKPSRVACLSSPQDGDERKEKSSDLSENRLKTSNNLQDDSARETAEQNTWNQHGSADQPNPCPRNEFSDNSQAAITSTDILSNLNEEENAIFLASCETKGSFIDVQSRGQGKAADHILDEMIIEVKGLGVQTSCNRDNSVSISQGKARISTKTLAVSPGRLSTASSPSRSIRTGTSSFESLTETIEILQQDIDESFEKIEHTKQKLDEQQQLLNSRPNLRAEAALAIFPRTLLPSESSSPGLPANVRNEHSLLNRIEEEAQDTMP